jgi:arylformamidase
MGNVVDLSHSIEHGMTTYPGIPPPELGDHLTRKASRARYAPGTEFHIGRITMVGNTGTYLDTPFHRHVDGTDLASTPLSRMAALDAVVVDAVGEAAIDVERLRGARVAGRAALIRTGWSRDWGSEAYFSGHPHLTLAAAAWLVEQQAALVGIDSLNIDGTETGERPVHTSLLAAGIPIVEHLCRLDQLPAEGFTFHAAPPAVVGLGSFPVRAYAVLGDQP